MNRIRPLIGVFVVLITFILLNDALICGFANAFTFFRDDNRLELYENTYKNKIDSLEKTISEYEKSMKELRIYEGTSHVLAKSGIRNIYDIYDYVMINTTSKTSVGDVVLNEDGLVGFIEEANKTSAKVSLITNADKLSVKVGSNYGILSEYDKVAGEFIIHNIDNYKVVNEGDEVTTSGLQDIEPDLPIGVVTSVENKGVEKIVHVKPHVDFKNLNYLIVKVK